jgi:hypothetical protein
MKPPLGGFFYALEDDIESVLLNIEEPNTNLLLKSSPSMDIFGFH